jgi:hypothetical protein
MEFSLILGVLKEGLKLWNAKEANKYIDKMISLEKDYYEELKKPHHERSQLTLDSIMLDVETIARNFVKFANKDK